MNNQRSINLFQIWLLMNIYCKKPEIDKLKDIIQPYYSNHRKKFDNFTICFMWKKNDVLINKISVPSTSTLEKPYFFKSSMIELPKVVRVSCLDFLDTFAKSKNNEVDEINIIFLSDLKDISFFHYTAQPKSLLCRKIVR